MYISSSASPFSPFAPLSLGLTLLLSPLPHGPIHEVTLQMRHSAASEGRGGEQVGDIKH